MPVKNAFDRSLLSDRDALLAEAVMRGQPIFLSLEKPFGMPQKLYTAREKTLLSDPLNTPLQRALRSHLHPLTRQPTHHRYRIHNVQDALTAINVIQHYGGNRFFDGVNIAYQGWLLPFKEFYRGNAQDNANLFHHLHQYAMMQDLTYCEAEGTQKIAYGIPRLLRFDPSNMTRRHPDMVINSANPVEIIPGRDKKILMRNRLDVKDGVNINTACFSKGLFILAVPSVNATAYNKEKARLLYTKRTKLTSFVETVWFIDTQEQVTRSKGHRLPRREHDNRQPRLI